MTIFDNDKILSSASKKNDTEGKDTVLIVDDEVHNLRVIEGALKREFEILKAESGEEALEILKNSVGKKEIKLILTDQRMPGISGTELLEQSEELYPDAMRIILTGYAQIDVVVRGINQCHIHMFLTKPFEPESLLLAAKRSIETYETEKKIRYLALNDWLTQLPNRNALIDFLSDELEALHDHSVSFALCMLHIDLLKEINSSLGYITGDQVITKTAQMLKANVPAPGYVARLNAAEFAIFYPETDESTAVKKCQALLKELNTSIDVNNVSIDLHPSIGICIFPLHGDNAEQLIQRADMARYLAMSTPEKHYVYNATIGMKSSDRLGLMGKLRGALENNDLTLHYQPKLDLISGTVTGFEALTRWYLGDKGFRVPDEFIPLAEQTKHIGQLTPWVMEQALELLSEIHSQGKSSEVSINISGADLARISFPDHVAKLLDRYSVKPKFLTLELTESAILGDPVDTIPALIRLRDMGVKIAIDDFGASLASVAQLINLPIHSVKISRQFISDLKRHQHTILVDAIVKLAHNLELSSVAVGVENQETLDHLKQLGCEYAQGYHIGRPMSAESICEWLQNQNSTQL